MARQVTTSVATLLDGLSDGNSGKTEAGVVGPEVRREPLALRRLARSAIVEPAASSDYLIRVQQINLGSTPLFHIAVHVAQAQPVCRISTNSCGMCHVRAFRGLA